MSEASVGQMPAQPLSDRVERLPGSANMLKILIELAAAVDARDPFTVEHSIRVADTSRAVARRMGWSGTEVADLHAAGIVHDVGRIAIPDDILSSTGGLTEAQFA